jgi:type III pantothenate kinase
MLLCLDAGNTRLKYGLREGAEWRSLGALDYAEFNDLPKRLPTPPRRMIACNVAGDPARAQIESLAARLRIPLDWLSSSAVACGISNGYDKPQQLGADRWAALIGARTLHAEACMVVVAGTATTIDVLDGQGRFLGGLILPGLALMRSALAQNTAGLPQARGRYRALATNTDDAIISGALHATLGAIERVRASQTQDIVCLLSGGAAVELVPQMKRPYRVIDNLVLEGLARFSLTL